MIDKTLKTLTRPREPARFGWPRRPPSTPFPRRPVHRVIILVAILVFASEYFFSIESFLNIARHSSMTAILAVGQPSCHYPRHRSLCRCHRRAVASVAAVS